MKKKYSNIYQFKIQLIEISPPIWRRIQVPETYSFWDLHVAIQDAMGWLDMHLHEFEIKNPNTGEIRNIGLPDDEYSGAREIIHERQAGISEWFSMEKRNARYDYDFGDGWSHQIKLEKILPKEQSIDYPICIAGKRACPPENCGGIPGYENILEVIEDPNHPEYEEISEWLGEIFDPEYFDAGEINFDNPEERWRLANSE